MSLEIDIWVRAIFRRIETDGCTVRSQKQVSMDNDVLNVAKDPKIVKERQQPQTDDSAIGQGQPGTFDALMVRQCFQVER